MLYWLHCSAFVSDLGRDREAALVPCTPINTSCQLSVVTAAAAPVLPVLSDGGLADGALGQHLVAVMLVFSVITLLVAAAERTGPISVPSGCFLAMSC